MGGALFGIAAILKEESFGLHSLTLFINILFLGASLVILILFWVLMNTEVIVSLLQPL
jgi:hypothetical protein